MNLSIRNEVFRQCGIGSKFLITVGPVWKTKLPPRNTWKTEEIIVRVAETFHTPYSLTFRVFFFKQGIRCDGRYLDFDISKNLWTYTKEKKRNTSYVVIHE
ncbi:MAG: hypothetical protein HZB09_02715 [Candidatus Yonathbacteria bacterium]|nr:hypothetical protein [Candidatus Yonathbacteria bacterium]